MTKEEKRGGVTAPKYRDMPDPSRLRPKPAKRHDPKHVFRVERWWPGWRSGSMRCPGHWSQIGLAKTDTEVGWLIGKELRSWPLSRPAMELRVIEIATGRVIRSVHNGEEPRP